MAVDPADKILSRFELLSRSQRWRSEGKRLVTTNGCFDLVHYGHARYLAAARALGDVLVCAVNSDESVRGLGKGTDRPFFPERVRAYLVASLEVVDHVVIFPEATPVDLLNSLQPAIHVKGGDYNINDLPERETVERHGGKIQLIPLEPGYSTTSIFDRIRG